MVLPGIDWKNQPRHILDWVTVAVALVLISIHLYQAVIDGAVHHYGIWAFFAAWLVVYFTDYWQPILYLMMAVVVAVITVFLLLSGYWKQPIDLATILLTTVFLLLMVYLFFYEGTL